MSNALQVMTVEGYKPGDDIIKKISADVNEDLIKKNEYDKFGNGDYISVETVTRILNEVFGCVWSWEIVDYIEKEKFLVCQGRLTIPGVGIRDGIGSVKLDKTDNSSSYSASNSFAFKNAAKKLGIAPNIFNPEGYEVPAFEHQVAQDEVPEKTPANATPPAKEAPPEKTPVKTEKTIPSGAAEKAAELKEVYEIKTKKQFVAFAQIWTPDIKTFADINEQDLEDLHTYVEENPEEFEDFVASEYQ